MIDLAGVLGNALWVMGLAAVLAVASHAFYRAQTAGASFRRVITIPRFAAVALSGLALIFAGLALTSAGSLWEALILWVLALLCGAQAAIAFHDRHVVAGSGSVVRRWLQGDRVLVIGLVTTGVLVAAVYALVILPWMQPDEPRHYEVALHVARLDKPVVTGRDRVPGWEQEMIAAMEGRSFWWYGFSMVGWDPNKLPDSFAEIWGAEYSTAFFQPPLYYALTGGLLTLWGKDLALDEGILRLRLVSLLLFGLSLVGIYCAIAELFPERRHWAVGVLALAALWPSHLAANASVNNDVLAEVLVVWSLYFAVHILRRGPHVGNVSWLLALALLGITTKRTALTAALIVPLTLLFWAVARTGPGDEPSGHRSRRKAVWIALTASVVVALALLAVLVQAGRLGLPEDFYTRLGSGVYWRDLLAYPIVAHTNSMMRTFVGWFGWMRVGLPAPLYWLGGGLMILALLGVLRLPLTPYHRALAGWQKRGLALFAIAILVQLVFIIGKQLLYADFSGESVPQMRYLYAVAPAVFLFVWLGWRVWVPVRLRRYMIPAIVVLLFVFNAYVLVFLLYPFYWL